MPSHSPAPSEVSALIADTIASHHPELAEVAVTINALFAYPAKAGMPAVKLHGYPKAAVVKINSEKDRVEGKADVTITIDGPAWRDDWSDEERAAVIDHECQHLTVARDKEGNPKTDDAGRPKLKMRLHDWENGGFDVIARRHGKAAFEVQAVRILASERGQLFWAWGDDQAPGDDVIPMGGPVSPRKPRKPAGRSVGGVGGAAGA